MGKNLLVTVLLAVVVYVMSGAVITGSLTGYRPLDGDPDGMAGTASGTEQVLTATGVESGVNNLPIAANVNPTDGATDVPRDVALTWPAGRYPGTYDVYLGTSAADVNSATRADTTGILASKGQADTTFGPSRSLAYGQTYYWRIDEVNQSADGTVYKGAVCCFTVEPYAYPVKPVSVTASSSQAGMGPEKTIDGSGLTGDQHGTEPATMWLSAGTQPNWIQYQFDKVYKLYDLKVWNSNQPAEGVLGFGVKKVTVEYSDGITWKTLDNAPEFARAPGQVDYAPNTTVSFGGVLAKYVRLTVNSTWAGVGGVTGLSEVRFSYIPVQAFGPQPADRTQEVSVNMTLRWRPGREAGSHKVFFGDYYPAAIEGASVAQPLGNHSFTPGDLNFGATYYWKVDEVNTVTYAGVVWSFTTQRDTAVDDFESYNDTNNRIYDTWIDGRTDGLSGSVVGYAQAPFVERTIVRGGRQAMPLQYDNLKPPYYSEASRTFDTPQNWTTHGADTLALYYRGYSVNFVDKGDNAYSIRSGGSNIGGTSDQFHFVYKQLNGNGSITMRVDSIGDSTASAKAGAMIRETLDAGSKNAYLAVTPSSGLSFQWRQTTGGVTAYSQTAGRTAPFWVRMTRTGNVCKAEWSADGKAWTPQGTDTTVPMTASAYIGMAVTSNDVMHPATAVISNVSTTGTVTDSWQRLGVGAAMWDNAPAALYLTVEDTAGRSKTVLGSDTAATVGDSWRQWTVLLSDLSAAGINLSAVKKLTIGVASSPKAAGTGLLYLDDITFGRYIYPRATRS